MHIDRILGFIDLHDPENDWEAITIATVAVGDLGAISFPFLDRLKEQRTTLMVEQHDESTEEEKYLQEAERCRLNR